MLVRLAQHFGGWKRLPVAHGVFATALLVSSAARADQLSVEQHEGEQGYAGVEELSYEAIVEPTDGYAATLRIRVALHNSSLSSRDVVHTISLPFAASIEAMAVGKGGVWSSGAPTRSMPDADRRNPGSVFVRELRPSGNALPSAEVVAFGLEPGATMQVEVTARVYPRLRGDRWELDLPTRGHVASNLAAERRVLVRGTSKFWVDDAENAGKPFMVSGAEDTVTAAWPSPRRTKETLDTHYEVIPGPPGFDDGQFRLYLRLGSTKPARPDHVVVLVDRSLSTPGRMQADTMKMVNGLLDALPESTTYEVLAFNRHVTAVLGEGERRPTAGDREAREVIGKNLAAIRRGQGTDLVAALHEAGKRSAKSKRPFVVVVTDGMLPARVGPKDVQSAFERGLGSRRRAEVLFVVDDPILTRTGLTPAHPVARIAAGLGARISLESLQQIADGDGAQMLSAPRMLGALATNLPEGMRLDDPMPPGLVAGNVMLLRGHYVGKPAPKLTLRGALGTQKVSRTVRARVQAEQPEALAGVVEGDLADAASEGFVLPPWYDETQRRSAAQGVAQASRYGYEPKGFLDKKIFRNYLTTRVLPRARACYNRALSRNTTQAGRVTLEMEVGKGEVMHAHTAHSKLEVEDAKLVTCMTEAAWALDIPAGKLDDQIYRIRYPLRLIAPEGGKPTGTVVQIPAEMMEILLAHEPG